MAGIAGIIILLLDVAILVLARDGRNKKKEMEVLLQRLDDALEGGEGAYAYDESMDSAIADRLNKLNVPIIGTGTEAIDKAENRDLFEKVVTECGIPQGTGVSGPGQDKIVDFRYLPSDPHPSFQYYAVYRAIAGKETGWAIQDACGSDTGAGRETGFFYERTN